ncbi:MAG: hypothetical protein ACOZNI_05515 [Myxococcota bacterium]
MRAAILLAALFALEAVLARLAVATDASAALLSPSPATAAPAIAVLLALIAARCALLVGAPAVGGLLLYRGIVPNRRRRDPPHPPP